MVNCYQSCKNSQDCFPLPLFHVYTHVSIRQVKTTQSCSLSFIAGNIHKQWIITIYACFERL